MYIKKIIITLVILLGSLGLMSCDKEPSLINIFKEKVNQAQSFDINVKLDSSTDNQYGDSSNITVVDDELEMKVSLTDDSYNIEADKTTILKQTYGEQTFENKSGSRTKIIDNKLYGAKKLFNGTKKSYWFELNEGYVFSYEASNFLHEYETKEDIKNLLTGFSSSIKEKKDSNNNILLDEKIYELIEKCVMFYYIYGDKTKVEISNKEFFVDLSNEEFVFKFNFKYVTEHAADSISTSNIDLTVKFKNFSSQTIDIKAPTEEEFYNGININDVLTTTGYDILEVDSNFGEMYLYFEYQNENGELYLYLELETIDVIKYGVPVEVNVIVAGGWNGQLLGDTTPYCEYFLEHTSFELTINEDNTFTLNVPKLSEIYDWYHNK